MAKLQDAQVFRPTEAEFADFNTYVTHVGQQCSSGIAVVVPPPSWKPRDSQLGHDDIDGIRIPDPIKQEVSTVGKGTWQVVNLELPSVVVSKFRRSHGNREPPPQRTASRRRVVSSPHDSAVDSSATKITVNVDSCRSKREHWDALRQRFWTSLSYAPAVYGADTEGSLFHECAGSWNLSQLKCLLSPLGRIPGVTTPYLYFGSWKALFAMHTEDADLYSINYLHMGAVKVWYAVAPEHADQVERVASQCFPDEASRCSQFLRHKASLLSPDLLLSRGIPVYTVVHEPGTFVITFPRAYHWGFNAGFNCAEATNFALEPWIEYGRNAQPCNCRSDSVRVDPDIVLQLNRDPSSAAALSAELERLAAGRGRSMVGLIPVGSGVGARGGGGGVGSGGGGAHGDAKDGHNNSSGGGGGEDDDDDDSFHPDSGNVAEEDEWTFFCQPCGLRCASTDPVERHPSGSMFECTKCRTWSHIECHPMYGPLAHKTGRPSHVPDDAVCQACTGRRTRAQAKRTRSLEAVEIPMKDKYRFSGSVAEKVRSSSSSSSSSSKKSPTAAEGTSGASTRRSSNPSQSRKGTPRKESTEGRRRGSSSRGARASLLEATSSNGVTVVARPPPMITLDTSHPSMRLGTGTPTKPKPKPAPKPKQAFDVDLLRQMSQDVPKTKVIELPTTTFKPKVGDDEDQGAAATSRSRSPEPRSSRPPYRNSDPRSSHPRGQRRSRSEVYDGRRSPPRSVAQASPRSATRRPPTRVSYEPARSRVAPPSSSSSSRRSVSPPVSRRRVSPPRARRSPPSSRKRGSPPPSTRRSPPRARRAPPSSRRHVSPPPSRRPVSPPRTRSQRERERGRSPPPRTASGWDVRERTGGPSSPQRRRRDYDDRGRRRDRDERDSGSASDAGHHMPQLGLPQAGGAAAMLLGLILQAQQQQQHHLLPQQGSAYPAPPSPGSQQQAVGAPVVREALALYAFQPSDISQIPLQPGMKGTVDVQRSTPDWSYVSFNGLQGFVPTSYVKLQ